MNLIEKIYDRKGFKREATLESLSNNKEIKEENVVLVAETGFYYDVVTEETDIPLENGLFAKVKENTMVKWIKDHMSKLAINEQGGDGHLSWRDKLKLDTVDEFANNYIHPKTAGNIHLPSGGTSGQILTNKASGEGQWSDTVTNLNVSGTFKIKGYEVGIEP